MELRVEQLEHGITHITPVGRLDTEGSAAINNELSSIAAAGRQIIVDMAQIEYLSSTGIRSLIVASQSAAANGGKLVLMSPTPAVADVLHTARISYIIPLCADLAQATRAVMA